MNGLIDLLGAEHVVFGSDFPHAEGLENPADFVGSISNRTDEEIRLVMRDNSRKVISPD